jgi:non-ribosomal peptide synthetase component F
MVGMFINTVPVRVQVPADAHVADWLRQLQKDFGEARPYEYSPLSKVQQWSDLPRGLFETILVFENFPDSAFPTRFADLAATKGRYETRTNYPLTVMIVPADDLSIRFFYDPNRFDERTIHALGQHKLSGLQSMIALGGVSVQRVVPDGRATAAAARRVEHDGGTVSKPFDCGAIVRSAGRAASRVHRRVLV